MPKVSLLPHYLHWHLTLNREPQTMKKTLSVRFASLLALLGLLSACATLPTPEEMKADIAQYQLPKTPEPGKAIVYVVRPTSLGGLIRFNVFVNSKEPDAEMGYTRGSQYIYFNLMPGDHEVLSKAENWAATNVSAKAGDIIFIQQNPSMGIIMARNNLFKIEDYEGKYHVKHLTLGTLLRAEPGVLMKTSEESAAAEPEKKTPSHARRRKNF